MSRKINETKAAKVKKIINKTAKIFKDLPPNEQEFIRFYVETYAFQRVTLKELEREINEAGCCEEYQNGANQKGMKASAALQAYNALYKSYNATVAILTEKLPPDKRNSRLGALMDE